MGILDCDYTKPKFTITVEVFQSSIRYGIQPINNNPIEYHEIIGALEIAKTMYIHRTSNKNAKIAAKQLKK